MVFGERIRPSPYKIKFLENQTCSVLCTKFYKAGESESDRKLMIMKKGRISFFLISSRLDVEYFFYFDFKG